ncbi:MAG: 2Fe-2S iron-sulfur cluster-binding protein [Bacteroidales bacterium]|jgi:[NiFe] hydrogenase diaphorase moiety small subunit|nr:2Fe-2S iron-sulfur cluster-binding protein [Bacteroidales bacterium]MDD4086091.1 2Fe-2S iron-sulfur cluster-binding protein [Bacteroidales bacterium]MDY0086083.1 2Fe-2S iron-sulfur cluster-binding protein [Bacteroidales bacterium]
MSNLIKFKIDGKECMAEAGKYIVDAAADNGIYIPTLCNMKGVKPKGACRICSVRINGRLMTSCTTPVTDGMEIESNSADIQDLRKSIIELLFVSGNHFCPACEKSGNCELQALAYRYQMMVPRYPYEFPTKPVDASSPRIIKDQNRCIFCKRCIKTIKDENGRSYFVFRNRGHKLEVVLDEEMGKTIDSATAHLAMENCPVGSILVKEKGFDTPIGKRKFDKEPIGSDIKL